MNNTRRTTIFICAMTLAALVSAAYATVMSHTPHAYLPIAVVLLAAATSRMKVKLPGINGNMSMNLPFLLIAIVALSGAEAVGAAIVSTAIQCWPRKDAKLNAQQMTFNLSMMTFATAVASIIAQAAFHQFAGMLCLVFATATLFLGQTVSVASIVAVSERKSVGPIWWNLAHLSFPYYVVSAGLVSMVQTMSSHLGWGLALAVFPVMYGIYRSYRLYFRNLGEQLQTPLVRAAGAGA